MEHMGKLEVKNEVHRQSCFGAQDWKNGTLKDGLKLLEQIGVRMF